MFIVTEQYSLSRSGFLNALISLWGKDERNANAIHEKDNVCSRSKTTANDRLKCHSKEDTVQWEITPNWDSEDVHLDNTAHRPLDFFPT